MYRTRVIPLLALLVGIAIGWCVSEALLELNQVGSDIENARDQIGAIPFFESKEKSYFICFKTWLAVSGLYEAKAVKNAKPILHWIKPDLLVKANLLEQEMKEFLESRKNEICKGPPYPVGEALLELGYDI